jgi:hypothetical protein
MDPRTMTDATASTDKDHRLLVAPACVAGASLLVANFGLHQEFRDAPVGFFGAEVPAKTNLQASVSWWALFLSLFMLFRTISRRARVIEAVAVMVGAVALYFEFQLRAPLFGGAPWLVFLIGLVMLWAAFDLRQGSALILGSSLSLLAIVSTLASPWNILLGTPWLLLVGMSFPLCVGIVSHFADRLRTP